MKKPLAFTDYKLNQLHEDFNNKFKDLKHIMDVSGIQNIHMENVLKDLIALYYIICGYTNGSKDAYNNRWNDTIQIIGIKNVN